MRIIMTSAINYRLAPEGPFPCGLHDAVHSFLYLTDPNGLAIQPENIIVAGDSAGGGLGKLTDIYNKFHSENYTYFLHDPPFFISFGVIVLSKGSLHAIARRRSIIF